MKPSSGLEPLQVNTAYHVDQNILTNIFKLHLAYTVHFLADWRHIIFNNSSVSCHAISYSAKKIMYGKVSSQLKKMHLLHMIEMKRRWMVRIWIALSFKMKLHEDFLITLLQDIRYFSKWEEINTQERIETVWTKLSP